MLLSTCPKQLQDWLPKLARIAQVAFRQWTYPYLQRRQTNTDLKRIQSVRELFVPSTGSLNSGHVLHQSGSGRPPRETGAQSAAACGCRHMGALKDWEGTGPFAVIQC